MRRTFPKVLATLTLLLAATAHASAPTPAPSVVPLRPLLDHPGVLQSDTKNALEYLLAQHQKLTGEHIVLGLFRSAGAESPEAKSRNLFQAWELNTRKTRGNSILLVFFSQEREAHMEIGYGFESVFTSEDADRIIHDFLLPDLDASGANRALSLTVFELLRTLESPLVASGDAERMLRQAGFEGPWEPLRKTGTWIWVTGLVLSGGLLLFTLYWLTAAEVHFSRFGAFRLRPWELVDWKKPLVRMGVLRVKQTESIRSAMGSERASGGGTHGRW